MTDFNAETSRVADAVPNSWVYRYLPSSVVPYAQLARWDRPIGWWLLLWPCWWSLALALGVFFQDPVLRENWTFFLPYLLAAFGAFQLGAIAMRGAGCTYNDIVDVDIDEKVARTASRPIPSGRVSRFQAWAFLGAQALLGLIVLLFLSMFKGGFNGFAFYLGLLSLGTVIVYPFAKRLTYWPQFFLGLAFSWGALMGWAVIHDDLHVAPFVLYAGCICWVIGYDTIYAHQDREDDAIVGVKSTARLFQDNTKPALLVLYVLATALFAFAFWQGGASLPTFLGLALGAGHLIWQIWTLDIDDADLCLRLFQSNNYFGAILFVGLLIDIVI